ncbi:MAG: bifunctional methylenetetrahydrofolate dehydrogenase/methenyltetrahydrofolate cyclohydrolase FolD [Azoarcus sp.]|jgi:methylenetetrahydrofolate dehydrogenase (NADP+)/methenyltetrahydrofolate cyclohydrolase|nr:bifunctional methylenetetrahydrofolate dehydrogenase/methenyltetrahydrofolate cyclohydrolase FolD [Azoarcus sp.]
MSALIIDGKAIAEKTLANAREETALLIKAGVHPGLAVVLVGEDPASQVYVKNKVEKARSCGIASFEHRLSAKTPETELLSLIHRLNQDNAIHGILVQLPLPPQISEQKVLAAIRPEKDVDGFHAENVGALQQGRQALTPCTPLGCLLLLKETLGQDLSGKHAIVIGRSNIVGKPMAALLLREHCAVTIVHSRVKNAAALSREADIVVAAVGRAGMVNADWVKPGATVIDVGINRITENGKNRLVGDVDFTSVSPVAAAITPVPGGVGPMTIACLMQNTVHAAKAIAGLP